MAETYITSDRQKERDSIQQNDHDKLIEYGVMLQTIIANQARQEEMIKELISGQAQALATWETKSQIVHDNQDAKIKKLEETALIYVPMVESLKHKCDLYVTELQLLKDNKNQLLGGWRVILHLIGSTAGIASFVWIILQIITHISFCTVNCPK